MAIRVFIADDHQVLVDGIKVMLEQEEGFAYAGAASSGEETIERLRDLSIDVLLLDINLPGIDGMETARQVGALYPEIAIMALTMHDGPKFVKGMLKNGANGYLLKNTGKQELLAAIRQLHSGEPYYSQEITKVLVGSITGQKRSQGINLKLSRREKEVLQLIMREFTTQEIADKMFVATSTVETHRRNLLNKLGARNVAGMVRIALENNLLDEK